MKLDSLKYLIAIKEYGSMNKAADHLYTSQQNISKAIKQLERDFGQKIFSYDKRQLTFTEDGARLWAFAQAYEKKRRELLDNLAEQALKNIQGEVRIGAMRTASAMVLPQILVHYYKDFPNISLKITDGSLEEIVTMLEEEKIDLAIVLMVTIKGKLCLDVPANLQVYQLLEASNCCWVSKDNPLSNFAEISIKETVRFPAIISAGSDIMMMNQLYTAYDGQLIIAAENENPYLLTELTSANVGIFPDVAIFDDDYLMKYAFLSQKNVVAVPISKTEGYQSGLYLMMNQKEKTVLERHIINFIVSSKWRRK